MSKFSDLATITVKAGDGGSGASHFRREKFVDKGGPDGGNGGRGGDIIFYADPNINTLISFHSQKFYNAQDGGPGAKQLMHGKDGQDLRLPVPVGTIIKDQTSQDIIGDLAHPEDTLTIAKGGRGGLGNAHFKSSTNQAPTFAETGEKGEQKTLLLELQLVADIGIIGIPSAGKSTLISRVSNAKPKIADYPFTTLIPNLGVVNMRQYDSKNPETFVIADIPGLIQGAHQGKGLGHDFLRHVSRNHLLLHLLDATRPDISLDYQTINTELSKHDAKLAKTRQIIAINKIDAVSDDQLQDQIKKLKQLLPPTQTIHTISAATGENIHQLIFDLHDQISDIKQNLPKPNKKIIQAKKQTGDQIKFISKTTRSNGKMEQTWQIISPRLEQVINMTDLDHPEGLQRVYHYLQSLGLKKRLQKRGAQPGDILKVATHTIKFRQ